MLEFLCGAAGSGKTEEIYRRAQADAAMGKTVFILVPDQYSMFAEQELISKLGLSAQNKIQIITFSRLSNMIFSKLGPLRTKYIDKAGKYLMACRAMQLSEKKLKFFVRNINQAGFVNLIVSAISEFKRYGVTPDGLLTASKNTDDAVLQMKLEDFAVIFEKFDELVCENHSNSEDSLALSVTKIPECDFIHGSVYVNFFRSFTPTEYHALTEIMKKADLCIALCCDTLSEKSVLFSSQFYVYSKLKQIGEELGTEVKKPVFLFEENRFKANAELRHIRDNFFSYKTPVINGNPKSVHILTPDNRYGEVLECARLIRRLCRTRGYSLNDILILTGSLEEYELIIPSIFEEFDINYFLDQKITLTESPLMRMIIAALEILAYGFSYERIMTIIRSGFWNISREDADIFENYLLAADITHKQWNSPEPWVYNPRPSAFNMETVNAAKEAVVSPILNLIKMFRGKKTVGEICKNLCASLNTMGLHEAVSVKIDEYINTGRLELAEQLHRVWNSFVSLVNQISDCMSDTYATFTDFYELFTAACGELSVGIVPPTQDKVLISEASRFRSTGTKVVIVLGVSDSAFPKSHNAEGLISDAERHALFDIGLTLAPDAYNRQKEEQFLVYSALTTACEQLYLFSPLSDRDGKSLGTSEVIKRIKELFPDIQSQGNSSDFDSVEGKENTFSELSARLFESGWNVDSLKPLWRQIYHIFEKDTKYCERLEHFNEMYSRKGEAQSISKKTAERLYGKPLILSVSKLEKYNSCAFSFFMKYGLYAEERLLGGLKATDTGSILHSVLCDYFKEKTNADYSKINRSDCFSEIAALVDKVASSQENSLFATSNYYNYMMLRLKNIATSTAWKMIKFYEQSKFRPTDFEISFGRRGKLPAYTIPTKHGEAYLEGFIDRVDSADIDGKTYISITDYKSSEKSIDPIEIDAGITIQPLIYANAVTNQNKSAEAAAMMYLQMNDPILKCDSPPTEYEWEAGMNDGIKIHGLFLDEPQVLQAIDKDPDSKNSIHYVNCDKKSRLPRESMNARLKGAESCAAQTADNILDGHIDAQPPRLPGFDPCAYCPYSSVCTEE
ncbi:MAG: PD-(D/E)XK nuclease family protein [Clostridia bacterium]|nr:PD-(D/E)XK nuclease family protein [Clostridia bacterium]